MFENQKILLRRNNSNNITKPQKINISNPKEKEMNNYVKNKSIEHREFGQDLTNLALTVFGNTNISQNKSILKAIQIIKANKKNKERSREKSLIKDRKQNNIKIEKTGNINVIKDRGLGIRPLEKKRFGKKNEINKDKSNNNLEKSKQSNFENINCDNNVNISEFSLETNQELKLFLLPLKSLDTLLTTKKEKKKKYEYFSNAKKWINKYKCIYIWYNISKISSTKRSNS